MSQDPYTFFITATFIGLVATALIDLWLLLLGRAGLPVTNWAMVGRWVGHLPRGRLIHTPIASSAPIAGERLLGWGFHYFIGIAYGLIYLLLVDGRPHPGSAIAFGLATVLVPWLLLQPGLGLGLFARRVPQAARLRAISLSVHTLFGCGLYAGWLLGQDLLSLAD